MARVVIQGMPHHVTQRGNRREDVFFCDNDRQKYLQLLLKYSDQHGLSTIAYCLMPNHVHLVCVPKHAASLAATFKPLNLRYAQHVNWTQDLTGRLWQGRFFSCVLSEKHMWNAIRYVERNPVRAGLVRRAADWPWSSASAHCGKRHDPILSPFPADPWVLPDAWADWLAIQEEQVVEEIRLCTRTGRPVGDKAFILDLEKRVGRPLIAKSVGRPRKEDK